MAVGSDLSRPRHMVGIGRFNGRARGPTLSKVCRAKLALCCARGVVSGPPQAGALGERPLLGASTTIEIWSLSLPREVST